MGKNYLLLFVALFSTQLLAEDAARDELKKLSGAWQLVSYVHDGKEATAKDIAPYRMVIDADKLTAYLGNATLKTAVLTLDPSRQSGTMLETSTAHRQIKSIYKLVGDTLTICSAEPSGVRPKDFASVTGSNQALWKFERIDPLRSALLLPGPKPLVYRSENSGIVIYVERDGHHVTAIDKNGEILWHKHLTKDWKWDFRPDNYVASIGHVGKPTDGQLRGANETFGQPAGTEYAYVQVERGFGLLNLRTGEFFGLGVD